MERSELSLGLTLSNAKEPFNHDFTEEFEDRELEEFEEYPIAFGITFTPRNSGIAAAVLGLLGSFYLLFNWVMPAYDTLQQLQNDAAGKQQQIDQQKSGLGPAELAKIESQLQQKEATKQQILALFAQEKNLSTILLDISKIFKSRNVKLISFQPQVLEPVVVSMVPSVARLIISSNVKLLTSRSKGIC